MAGEIKPIEVVITTKDLTAAGVDSAKARFAAAGKDMERSGSGAKLAMWGLGEQAENLAQSMGVPMQMSRRLGNTFEDFSSRISPGMAIGFGAIALAGMGLYAVYSHLAEKQKKLQEETLKAADASMKWIDQARIETRETDNLRKAKDALWQIEKEQNIVNLERGIKAQTDLIIKQFDQVEKMGSRAKMSESSHTLLGRILFGDKATREREFQDMSFESKKSIEKLMIMYEELDIAKGKGTLRRGGKGDDEARAKAELSHANTVEEMMRSLRERSLSAGLLSDERELAQLDAKHGMELQKLLDHHATVNQIEEAQRIQRGEKKDLEAKQDLKRHQQALKQEEQIQQLKYQTASAWLTAVNSMTQGKYKALYLTMQAMLAGQAIMHGEAAAVAALSPPPTGLGPVLGSGLAFWARAQGYASAAAIMAQAWMSSSGGGGGSEAAPVYSANPVTGYPENNGQYSADYGTGGRPGEGQWQGGRGDTYIINGDIYSDDATFRKKVAASWSQDYKDNGPTKKTMEDYR